MRSIRRRLLLLQLSAVLLVGVLSVAGAYYRVRDVFYETQDYHLEQVALLLMQQGELTDAHGGALLPGEDDLEFIGQVWSENGKLVYSSHRDYPLPQPARVGLRTVEWDDEWFRIYAISRGGRTVQVAQSIELREEALRSITLRLLAPLALIVPLLGIATWVTVGRGLRPLAALREEVVRRNPASLTPIALEHAPDEVRPLVGSLNELLSRLGEALDSQRRFTADAAHELRTPLTGVKLQFQLLERAQSSDDRQRAIDQLKAGIDRAIRLVQQLLTLARLEPEAGAAAPGRVALAPLVLGVVEDFAAHAKVKDLALTVTGSDDATVLGNDEQIRTLLGNLLDNAVRYTPQGGTVSVSLAALADDAVLEVADSGPGIPAGEREQVFDRFYRVEGSGAPGSGLGLSIVQRVADAHAAQITLEDAPAGGLLVRVRFPLLKSAS
jgi:two-component system OmpR family sensor kinase